MFIAFTINDSEVVYEDGFVLAKTAQEAFTEHCDNNLLDGAVEMSYVRVAELGDMLVPEFTPPKLVKIAANKAKKK